MIKEIKVSKVYTWFNSIININCIYCNITSFFFLLGLLKIKVLLSYVCLCNEWICLNLTFLSQFSHAFPWHYSYVFIYHTWKIVDILAIGCRHYGAKNDAKRQKTAQYCQNQPKIKGNIRLNGKVNFLVADVIKIFPRIVYITSSSSICFFITWNIIFSMVK